MPKRDGSRPDSIEAGPLVSRRAVLAGVGVALCAPQATWAAAAPLRIGVPGVLGIGPERLAALSGRAVAVVPYDGWGSLRDHAACGGAGLIDAAVLPVAGTAEGPAVAVASATLWLRTGCDPRRLGVPVVHPESDAALHRLFGHDLRIVPMPPGALWPNLVAGLLDGAVLLGEGAPADAGLRPVPLSAREAAALLPPLELVATGAGA